MEKQDASYKISVWIMHTGIELTQRTRRIGTSTWHEFNESEPSVNGPPRLAVVVGDWISFLDGLDHAFSRLYQWILCGFNIGKSTVKRR